MHLLIYTTDERVLEHTASTLKMCVNENDIITRINSYNGFISFMEDWGYTVDVLVTEPDIGSMGELGVLQFIRRNYPAVQFVFLNSGKPVVYFNHCVTHSALLAVPIDRGMAIRALNECRTMSDQNRQAGLSLSDRNITTFMPFGSIIYIESQARSVRVYTPFSAINVNETLTSVEKRLDGRFIKCHQSYLVNVNYVRMYVCDPDDMNYACLELTNGERIPVSVRKQKYTRSFYEDYCRKLIHENSRYIVTQDQYGGTEWILQR